MQISSLHLSYVVVFFPGLSFLWAGLWAILGTTEGEQSRRTSFILWISVLSVSVSALLAWWFFLFYYPPEGVIPLAEWMQVGNLHIEWSLRLDRLSLLMLVVIASVSALVHLYSLGYMKEDKSQLRFFSYLSLFTFAMMMLVTADNLIQLFFGWEGVGLASYLLIGFWYEKPSANAAAMKAFIVNRIADVGFLLGIFLLYWVTSAVDYESIFYLSQHLAKNTFEFFGLQLDFLTLACFLLFIGACGKSAQFLFHVWLPDAMEGPTPVSALIHAATMVTAGIFMVARLSPLFAQAPFVLNLMMGVGATTALFAASVALVQNDIKRVIAYSTCSQLGYMFVALGAGGYGIAMFHLFTHAFFKALLFLGAGSVIHIMHHEQNMQHMAARNQEGKPLWREVPVTFIMMLAGTFALTGFPGTAGYFSKDAIIEAAFVSTQPGSMVVFLLLLLTAGLTSFYSWRLMFLVFFKPLDQKTKREEKEKEKASLSSVGIISGGIILGSLPTPSQGSHWGSDSTHSSHSAPIAIHESPFVMLMPLLLLSSGALGAGWLWKEDFLSPAAGEFWNHILARGHEESLLKEMHHLPTFISSLPLLMMVLGFVGALFLYLIYPLSARKLSEKFPKLYLFLLNKWYIDELYEVIFVRPLFWAGKFFWKIGDKKIIDGLGPEGVSARILDLVQGSIKLQTGYLSHYVFTMLMGVSIFLAFYMFLQIF